MKYTPETFMARVEGPRFDGDCARWSGGPSTDGYGSVYVGEGRSMQTHRLAYLLLVGPIPAGLQVQHTCDNRVCVSPAHLKLGTPADNGRDRAVRGRARNAYTSRTLGEVEYTR